MTTKTKLQKNQEAKISLLTLTENRITKLEILECIN